MTPPRLIALLLTVLVMAGCASSRYSMDKDAAPVASVDVNQIPSVVPHPVTRSSVGNKSPYTVWGKTYQVLASAKGYHARGLASWYGAKFHGHRTSDGEIFNMYRYSAAHRTLPLPCFVRVTNLENGRSLIVRVNDRGPFHSDRLIDLSYAAAKKLGYAAQGTTMVQIDAIDPDTAEEVRVASSPSSPDVTPSTPTMPPSAASDGGLFVQVAAFTNEAAAQRLVSRLRQLLQSPARIVDAGDQSKVIHRVQVGPFSSQADATAVKEQLQRNGFDSPILVGASVGGSS
ncbi:septal ring lytic transglycosylase RlpA family protein [Mangrovitalea sediminis]|uniref:septal ring lytic transglycosylase RlpA family protein n=1 Tax=Mangrovitalea sediminis TaxID=1982043 RepID=UPI0013044187|nr:septal ring lytic transglycosylase RlpA family protein [Mangrovitalea sediminis]